MPFRPRSIGGSTHALPARTTARPGRGVARLPGRGPVPVARGRHRRRDRGVEQGPGRAAGGVDGRPAGAGGGAGGAGGGCWGGGGGGGRGGGGGGAFFERRRGAQQPPVLLVREADGPERALVDPSALADDDTITLDDWVPPLEGDRLAQFLSQGGDGEAASF